MFYRLVHHEWRQALRYLPITAVLRSGLGATLMRASIAAMALVAVASAQKGTDAPNYELFLQAAQVDEKASRAALNELAGKWRDSYASLVVDMARLMTPPPPPGAGDKRRPVNLGNIDDGSPVQTPGLEEPSRQVNPSSQVRQRLIQFLEKQTHQRFGDDLDRWRKWMWKLSYEPHPDYAAFKGQLYSTIDPRMANFFSPGAKSLVRLDEIDWGGVRVNGIPPLVYPKTVSANEASYLRTSNIVFGIFINGEARAYPKRILAWHELARDRVGGLELTIVYCTLCGTVLPYESEAGGKLRVLGTSGLLYRSNKLMFDEETKSLWSTLLGKPVVGPLAGADIELKVHPSVTTTWGEWRELHPDTRVLSLDTGIKRDYSEGAAYREYFSTDRIMFQVSQQDKRLKNKAEVLVMQLEHAGTKQPVAVAIDFLKQNPVYSYSAGGRSLVIVSTQDGANRVYDSADVHFDRRVANDRITDSMGNSWRVTEEGLVLASRSLPRVPANRAFWFGWYAQFPNTVLVK